MSALDVVAVEIDTCRVKSRRQPFASGMLKLGMLSIFSLYLLPASFESKNEGKKKERRLSRRRSRETRIELRFRADQFRESSLPLAHVG